MLSARLGDEPPRFRQLTGCLGPDCDGVIAFDEAHLMKNAAGTKRGSGDWEIAYRFAASPNVTGLTVGDITGINKKG